MSDEPLSFEEHRRRREENASTVRCARCGMWIVATATQCSECGIHFSGEAQDFVHPTEREDSSLYTPLWVLAVAVLMILAMLVAR